MRSEPQVHRAVILAAGQSRRLDALKLDRPKPLLEVAGKPLLFHHLERCAAEGVTDVFINLFHRAEQICEAVGDGTRFGLRVHYHLEPELAGTGGGVRAFAEELHGEPFFVLDLFAA
jgi:MurNAc alpha-1-phosphate uridylyltransferase